MFEYINPGFIVLSSIIIFLMLLLAILESGKAKSENRKPKNPIFLLLTVGVVVFITLSNAYSVKSTIESNKKAFENNQVLECFSHLVSAKDGWIIHNDKFLKDSLLVHSSGCEVMTLDKYEE